MSRPLPDPAWTARPSFCVVCGYSLEGLDVPGLCPECGAPFDRDVLVLAGVPTRTGGPVWRRLVWGLLICATLVYSQLLGFFIMTMAWELNLSFGLVIVIGVAAMLVTSPRERRGRERFILSSAGIARVPLSEDLRPDGMDSIITPWGAANEIEVKRHSAFWRRLRIGHRPGRGHSAFTVMFDAGVRCPDNDEARVLATIRAYLNPPPGSPAAPTA